MNRDSEPDVASCSPEVPDTAYFSTWAAITIFCTSEVPS